MSHCGPRMEIVRQLDFKAPFPDHQNFKRFRGYTEKSICALTYSRLCFGSLSERGDFSGKFNGCFLCRISRLCVVIRGVHGAVF